VELSIFVAAFLFLVLICVIDREKSAVSHSITWQHPLAARRVDIEGATAFAVAGLFILPVRSYFVIMFGLQYVVTRLRLLLCLFLCLSLTLGFEMRVAF